MIDGTDRQGALAGLKVVDLSRVLAGPMCSMILADHGADVIKVEPPQGDDTRRWGPPFQVNEDGGLGDASYYIGLNRNKRGLALDVGRSEGREVLLRLLEDADVLIENFKPGTMEKWGLSFEKDLAPRFPKLVYCRVSGFGTDGPLGGLPGYDAVLQAMTGLMSVNGDASTGPLRLGAPVVDISTGLYTVIGVLMALQERSRSGRGQMVDMTLYDCGMALLHPHAANYLLSQKLPILQGNSHPNVVPCDKFSTRTGDIFVVIGNEGQFRKFMDVLGRSDIADDPRFATNRARSANRAELTQLLAELLSGEEAEEISVRMLEAGVPVGPVMTIDKALAADHTASRRMLLTKGDYRAVGTPVKLSRTPASLRLTPPKFGAHTAEILKEHQYDDAAIAALRDGGITPSDMR